jgi:probable phosphoglycerate mutase
MREKERSTHVIFLRHGKTDFPLDRIYCDDREDPPLNAEGERQAAAAAALLHGREVAAIYTSPVQRTAATAARAAARLGLTPQPVEALKERHFGIWEGLYFDDIANGYPEEYRRWKQDNAGFKPEGGESVYDLAQRLAGWFDIMVPRHRGETVVVVSHVGPIRVAVAAALTLPLAEYRRLTIDYASLTQVDYGRSQNNLACLNVTGFAADTPRLADG